MLFLHIKTGDRVEITRLEDEGGEPHVTQAEAVYSKDDVAIHSPLSYGHVVRLGVNRRYAFLFFTDKGMVRFVGRIKRHGKEDGFDMTYIVLESDGIFVQRREFYRFACLLPFQFISECEVKKAAKQGEDDFLREAVINDISGGGLRFVSNEQLDTEETISAVLNLSGRTIFVPAKILSREHMPNMLYKYQYSTKFVDISPKDRESIVQFIFSEQRKRLSGEG